MSVDLPAALAPERSTLPAIRQLGGLEAGHAVVATLGGYRIHVSGERLLPAQQIEAAVRGIENLAEALHAIASAYYLAGYPAAQLRYALVERDLHVLVLPGRIEAVSGASELLAYFRPLIDEDVLTAQALEPARALAGVHAQRMGKSARLMLRPGRTPGRWRLDVALSAPSQPRFSARLEAGNPGNRYVGRDFAEAEFSVSAGAGELRVLHREGLGSRIAGQAAYRDFSLGSGLVSRYGVVGIDGRSVDYRQAVADTFFDGRQSMVGVSWSLMPYADFSTRWLVTLRLDDTDDRVSDAAGTVALAQSYPSAEISMLRSKAWNHGRWSMGLQAGLTARAGLHSGLTEDGQARLAYRTYRPFVDFTAAQPESGQWSLGVAVSGQFGDERLPQQQQYVLGGNGNLTAWLPGVLVANRGYLLRAESDWTLTYRGLELTPRLFAEMGSVQPDNAQARAAQTLADAGVEVAVRVGGWLEASIAAAYPLREEGDSPEIGDARADAFFRITVRY